VLKPLVAWLSLALSPAVGGLAATSGALDRHPLPVVAANANRHPAGRMRGDTLVVHLEIRMARWYPEAPGGPFVDAPVWAEVGKAPQIPGPLLRVREGTQVVATVTNTLADSVVDVHGLMTHGGGSPDSVQLKPGETRTLSFAAGRPGTYLYYARAGLVDWNAREREQLAGAFVIDSAGSQPNDRVLVINIWGETIDSATYRNALAINGRSWPYTERIQASVGDTLRWRVVNASVRPHPMHLHGFYYRILSKGDGSSDTTYAPGARRMVVTETMLPGQTMSLEWVPDREGNWLFHCHLAFHVIPETRLEPVSEHAEHMSGDVTRHMAGLVLGITVHPRARVREVRAHARALRLLVQEGRRHGRAPRSLGFVLQQGRAPAPDSVEIPGTPLILTRGEPTDITVINHLHEPTAVHWHGIELDSYSDGVAGWSGEGDRVAPAIAPGDSFVAHLTLPRAGTFIYHTHLNDIEQLTSGLYGGIVVLEPGARFDSTTDHLLVVGWDGPQDPPHLLVNGDSLPPPLVLAAGLHHRLRFAFIGAVGGETFGVFHGDSVAQWRSLAKDGADLPESQRTTGAAQVTGWAGETYDFDFLPPAVGAYRLVVGNPAKPDWTRAVLVR
jgi:FtsP/CotA-like multicopper oxidase with cupredoxin domain